MSQTRWIKPGLAIGISLLIHISLGSVLVVHRKTGNQVDLGRSQDVVIYLDSTSTIEQDASPASDEVKAIRKNLRRRQTDTPTSKPAKSASKPLEKVLTETKTVKSTNKVASQQQTIVTNPVYRKWKKPVYPRRSIVKNQQGKVLVDARIDEQGRVIDLEIHQSSGHPLLDRSAIKSVKHWIFEPVKRYGLTTDAMVRVPVNFILVQR